MLANLNKIWNARVIYTLATLDAVVIVIGRLTLWENIRTRARLVNM